MPQHAEENAKPRVVIVGAGFGGIAAATALARAPVDVTIIDRRNFHLFQPLLYQVATAALSPSEIAMPIRTLFKRQRNCSVILDRVTGIDTRAREVQIGEKRVPYDFLVLATGARHSYFGREDWEPHAPGLKKIDDAVAIRRRILEAFERAESETDPDARARLLTFVIVGGGPTGVEMAGAIAELAKKVLVHEFRHMDPGAARILLVEAGSRVLPSFPEDLSDKARRALERLGVEVLLGGPVTECDVDGVVVAGRRVKAGTVIWAAGVIASPAATWLRVKSDTIGRVMVSPDLSVPGHPDVFVIGDTACVPGPDRRPLPGVAAVAKQQGGHIGRLQLSGWIAWIAGPCYFLVGLRNRVVVAVTWLWAYLTDQRSSRLIIGDGPLESARSLQFFGPAPPAPDADCPRKEAPDVLRSPGLGTASRAAQPVSR